MAFSTATAIGQPSSGEGDAENGPESRKRSAEDDSAAAKEGSAAAAEEEEPEGTPPPKPAKKKVKIGKKSAHVRTS